MLYTPTKGLSGNPPLTFVWGLSKKKLYYGSITCYTKNLCPILFCPWESRALFLSPFLCSFVVLLRVPPVALIVDYKVVPIGVAYDIQNQVLGSTSQLI